MPARLHHYSACLPHIQAEMLEKRRVGALRADGNHHHRHAANLQSCRGAKRHGGAGENAAPTRHAPIRKRHHFRFRAEGFAEGIIGSDIAVKSRGEARTLAKTMCLRSQGRIMNHAHQAISDPGAMEGFQNPHGIAAPAAAGIIGNISKSQRHGAMQRLLRGIFQGGQIGDEAPTPFPCRRCQPIRQRFRRRLICRRDDHCHAIERRVAIGKAAHDGDIGNALILRRPFLAEVDHLGIRPLRGQHGNRGRHNRQAAEGAMKTLTGQKAAHQNGAFRATFAHIQMRVGAIANKGIGQRHHAV